MSLSVSRGTRRGGSRKTDSILQFCFPLTNTAIKNWNLFTRQNMVKHSCALHPLNGFKYWPVFSVFVLVPSAHIGVHGLFHSLIISPPAASAENEVIIQQAVQGFPNQTDCEEPCFHSSGIPVAVNSTAQPATGGTLLTLALLPIYESNLGSKVRKALKITLISPRWFSHFLMKLDCLQPSLQLQSDERFRSSWKEKVQLYLNKAGRKGG